MGLFADFQHEHVKRPRHVRGNELNTLRKRTAAAQMAESLRVPGRFDFPILDAVGRAEMHQHDCYVLARRDGSRLFVDSRTFLPVRFTTATTAIDGASDLAMDAYNAPLSIVAPVGAVSMASLFH
jgi:hypothetical protein